MNQQTSNHGVERTLAVIGGKWTLLVVRELLSGERRFCEIETALPGISPRLLAGRLKELEADGIVTRDCTSGHPVYALTQRGQSLHGILDQMRSWGEATG